MDSGTADVGGSTRRDQASVRRRNKNLDQQNETRKTGSSEKETLYDGGIYEGEYGDGNIAGIVLMAGKRKSGKTWLQWREFQLAKCRRIIFDPKNQYRSEKGYDISGWTVLHRPGELRMHLAHHINSEVVKVIYKPLSGELMWHFKAVTRIVLEYGQRSKGVLYGVDEIDLFCDPGVKLKDGCPQLHQVVEYGRHHGVSMSCTTRRPHAVSRSLTAECAEFRIFKTNEPLDKKYFEKYIGSAVKELPNLGKYEYLWWIDTGDSEVRGGKV
jgi:hypothetical protein